jgi:hypothetical protein
LNGYALQHKADGTFVFTSSDLAATTTVTTPAQSLAIGEEVRVSVHWTANNLSVELNDVLLQQVTGSRAVPVSAPTEIVIGSAVDGTANALIELHEMFIYGHAAV